MLGRRGKEEKERERGRIRMKAKGCDEKYYLALLRTRIDRMIIPGLIVASSPHEN